MTVFIAELTSRAWLVAQAHKRRTLQKSDVAAAIGFSDMFDFLIDIVPREETPTKSDNTTKKKNNNSNGNNATTASTGPANTKVKQDGGAERPSDATDETPGPNQAQKRKRPVDDEAKR